MLAAWWVGALADYGDSDDRPLRVARIFLPLSWRFAASA
jgi:hypothetical protein